MSRREILFAGGLSLLCAVLALSVATTSSPLYATNFWTDTNVYFTIGRGMTQGLMPYRDLFDHKGPLLYLLYALGACLSGTDFAGVFMLEAASLAATLLAGYAGIRLYGRGALSCLAIPATAMLTATCTAFTQGGSAGEFCLPALASGLFIALRRMREGPACAHPLRLHAAFGAAAGWVFLIKYTGCGLFFGLGACLLGWEAWTGGIRRAAGAGMAMLGGMLALLLPTALYLGANGALGACIDVYFVQNLFTYSGEPMTGGGHVLNALAYLRTQSAANPAVAGMAALGCLWGMGSALASRKKGWLFEAATVPLGAGLLLLTVYWGEMAHPYYALVFAALCPLGFSPLVGWEKPACGTKAAPILCGGLVLAILPVCRALCAAVPLMEVKREQMPQTVFAAIMREEESPTLLDLTSLDQGFYLAAGITPSCRYFADNNLQTEEKKQALAGYIERRETQFIVTRYRDVGDGYELVAEETGVFDLHDTRTYRLYRRLESEFKS